MSKAIVIERHRWRGLSAERREGVRLYVVGWLTIALMRDSLLDLIRQLRQTLGPRP